MKRTRKVTAKEVKRAFAIAHLIKGKDGKNPKVGRITKTEFEKRLAHAKRRVSRMTEKQLDALIRWQPRVRAYNACDWYLGTVRTQEVGVWKRAGELPTSWTSGSLKDTAERVEKSLKDRRSLAHTRANSAIHGILETSLGLLQREKCLFPIIFASGIGTRGRKGLRRSFAGDIDDGCMRSIALAMSGKKTIKAYIGMPK
jgi:hypothetical protein